MIVNTQNQVIKILETILSLKDIELIHCIVESLLDDLKDSKMEKDEFNNEFKS